MKRIFFAAALALAGFFPASAQNITAVEYAIDTDNGFGNGTIVNLTPARDSTFDFEVNTAGLSKGYHTLYFRTLDSDGTWSHTSYRIIEILDDIALNMVESAEFFNNQPGDFGTGIYKAMPTPAVDGSFVINFPYTEVVAGDVTLFMRVKDTKGQWSFPASKTFTIVKRNDPSGIQDPAGNRFSIYPNPAVNELTIEFKEQPKERTGMVLVDITGRTVAAQSIHSARTTVQLNYPPGNYFLKIRSGDNEVVQKITIVR